MTLTMLYSASKVKKGSKRAMKKRVQKLLSVINKQERSFIIAMVLMGTFNFILIYFMINK